MDVKLPKLGEGADTGTVVSILVKQGDTVTKGQTIIELENEKAVAPIPSPEAGTVTSIRVKEGDKLSVGQVILSISGGAGGGEAPAAPAAAAKAPAKKKAAPALTAEPEPEAEEEVSDEPLPDNAEVAASPSIRQAARWFGIDLTKIRGSANGGRIVAEDVRAYLQRLQRLAAQPKAAAGVAAAPAKPVAESIDFSQWGEVTKKPMTPLRKVISRRMVENWNAIPHVTQFDEVDVSVMTDLRKKFAPAYEKQGAKLTMTPLILKAVANALKAHPIFNSSIDEAAEEIVLKSYYHLGIAVDTDAGLIVPVLRNVDKKSVLELSKELEELAKKARDRKVSGEDLKGGTFTISNQGAIGGGHFTPIVNKPEVAILGLGRGAQKPVVVDGKVVVRNLLPIAISYDHRVIDGGAAARFTVDLVKALQNFPEADVAL